MATIAIEGFDHVATPGQFALKPGWNVTLQQAAGGLFNAINFVGGRLLGSAIQLICGESSGTSGTNIAAVTKTLPTSYATLICGFAFQWSSGFVSIAENFSFLTAANGRVLSLRLNGTTGGSVANLEVLNAAGTVVATCATSFVSGTWYYLEVKCAVGAAGAVSIKVNGVLDGNVTGISVNTGTINISKIQFNAQSLSTAGANPYVIPIFDDVYVADTSGPAPRNDFLGDCRVETLYPTADGAHLDWTPSSGPDHYTRVNQTTPDDDTTYVKDKTPGDIDTYVPTSLASVSGQVFGVQTNLYARKDDAATRQIAPVIRMGSSDYVGLTSAGLSSSYLYYSQMYERDPTATDWTIASVNAAQFGIKEVV
jgi:hypothetical protein